MESNGMQNVEIVVHFDTPEPGQLVEVRRRRWVVNYVTAGTLTRSSNSRQHLVNLSSLDEDFSGEEIQVIWELEPGARVLEKAGLPSITGCYQCGSQFSSITFS